MSTGGDLSMFTVERKDGTSIDTVDVLVCGNGQWGGLGNSVFSNAQSNPVRAKGVSGLLECESACYPTSFRLICKCDRQIFSFRSYVLQITNARKTCSLYVRTRYQFHRPGMYWSRLRLWPDQLGCTVGETLWFGEPTTTSSWV